MDYRTKVSIRDFSIFQLKLLIDGGKDWIVFLISFVAFGADLVFGRRGKRRYFPRLMRVSERFDLWLNLHSAVEHMDDTDDGLFGASEAGSDTLLGQIEQAVRGGDEPRSKPPLEPPSNPDS
ncbi:MAG: hypothetical protein IH968_09725 [Gemmatimonadetes bacterium]|nr:hypothetical protein [Gemmatimonadota bacterium]